MEPKESVKACNEYTCCMATGMELKLPNSLSQLQGVDREVAEVSAERCVHALHAEYNKKGGCDNAEIERISPLVKLGGAYTNGEG